MQIEQLSRKLDTTEKQKASLAYVVSIVVLIASVPLPLAGFLGTLGYAKVQEKYSNFVKYHCWQAVFSQLLVLIFTSIFWGWTAQILFTSKDFAQEYFYYVGFLVVFILIETIFAIVSAYQIEKGKHPKWWVIGAFLDQRIEDVEKN
ncbi:MAG: hypothetical protein LAT51_09805 [Flavobacteriaceae bacterium]|nr:hypothetical protein [Flavobacteriaceae bacterium]